MVSCSYCTSIKIRDWTLPINKLCYTTIMFYATAVLELPVRKFLQIVFPFHFKHSNLTSMRNKKIRGSSTWESTYFLIPCCFGFFDICLKNRVANCVVNWILFTSHFRQLCLHVFISADNFQASDWLMVPTLYRNTSNCAGTHVFLHTLSDIWNSHYSEGQQGIVDGITV